MFECKIILDSISPIGKRITTLVATYPRFIHSELLTHRMLSRNSASSRAIPWSKMMTMIQDDPVIPIHWGLEQGGMQSGEEQASEQDCLHHWEKARVDALFHAKCLAELGVHKSICNRLTEPFMWISTLITATEWNNFFKLRLASDAERHFQFIAQMMKKCIDESQPIILDYGEWHMPFIDTVDTDKISDQKTIGWELEEIDLRQISVARCARISYLTHEGKRDFSEDLKLYNKLVKAPHASPFEHVATPLPGSYRSGNFIGWHMFRKDVPNECIEG